MPEWAFNWFKIGGKDILKCIAKSMSALVCTNYETCYLSFFIVL